LKIGLKQKIKYNMNDLDKISGAVYGVCASDLDQKELAMVVGAYEQIDNVDMWVKYHTYCEGDPRD
jgi:hypothetical protein